MTKTRKTWLTAILAVAILSLVCVISTSTSVNAKAEVKELPTSITYSSTDKLNYQGENNRYFLSGSYADGNLYRMFVNNMYSNANQLVWHGVSNDTNWILHNADYNLMYPYAGADVVMAQVVNYSGTLAFEGAVNNSMAAEGNTIKFGIYIKRSDGSADTTVWTSGNFVAGGTDHEMLPEDLTVEVTAGDTVYYVATTDASVAWNAVVPFITATLTDCSVESEVSFTSLKQQKLAYSTAHTGGVDATNNIVNGGIFTNTSMKVANNGIGYVWAVNKYADGNVNQFATDGSVYKIYGTDLDFNSTSTGINVNRVFYSNIGWCGDAGLMFVAPADGIVNLLGLATVINAASGLNLRIVSSAASIAGATISVAGVSATNLCAAGACVDFASVEAANSISVKKDDGVLITFDSTDAWQSGSLAMAFDFYAAPAVETGISVEFDSVGGSDVSNLAVASGDVITEPTAPVKEGYAFVGWYNGDAAYDFSAEVTEDLTLTAKWEIEIYTATVVYADETTEEISYTIENRTEKLAELSAKLHANTAEYTYTWSAELPAELPLADATYTEVATKVSYTVTFDGENAQQIEYGVTVTKPEDPTKEGFAFGGWYNGEVAWNFETDTVTSDVNLTSKWTEVEPVVTDCFAGIGAGSFFALAFVAFAGVALKKRK